ncbi:MAG: FadR/GntR family transcriptional regulator [Caulobacteraceae bacterium]
MTSSARRKLKRPELLADEIRRWVVETGARPGERLPNEAELRRRFGVGKGAVREALKALEVQGLVALKTGPGGGGALTAPDFERSFQLWLNHFFFQPVRVEQIYALRRVVEP